jgi:hypothetical protein
VLIRYSTYYFLVIMTAECYCLSSSVSPDCAIIFFSLSVLSPVAVNNCSIICHAFLSSTVHCEKGGTEQKGCNLTCGGSSGCLRLGRSDYPRVLRLRPDHKTHSQTVNLQRNPYSIL